MQRARERGQKCKRAVLYCVRCKPWCYRPSWTHARDWLNVKTLRDQSQHRWLEHRLCTDLGLQYAAPLGLFPQSEDTPGTACSSSSKAMGFSHFLTLHLLCPLQQNHLETICSHRNERHRHGDSQKPSLNEVFQIFSQWSGQNCRVMSTTSSSPVASQMDFRGLETTNTS